MVSTDPGRAVYSYVSPNSGGQLWGPFCVDCMNGIHALKTSSFYSNVDGEEALPIYLHTKSGGKVFKINQLIYRNGSSTPFLFHKLPAEFELVLMNCMSNDCKNRPQPAKAKTVQTTPVPCKTKWSQTDPTVPTASQTAAKENCSSQGIVKPPARKPDVTIPPATLTTAKAVSHLPDVGNSVPFKVDCSTRFPLMFGTKKRDVPPVGSKEWDIRAKNIDRLLNTMTPHDQQQFNWYLEQRNWKADRCVCDVCPARLLNCGYIKHVISDAHRQNLVKNGIWVTRSHFNVLEKFLVLVLNQLYGRDIHDMKSGAASFISLQPFPLLQLSKQSYEGISSPQIITELQKKAAKIDPCVIDDHFPGLFLDIERCAFCSEVVSPKTVVKHVLSDKHMKLVLTRGQKPPSYDLLRLAAFLDLTIAGDSIESAGLSPPSTKWSPVDTTNRKASEMPLMAYDSSFGGRVLTRFEFDKGMKSMVDQLAQTDIDKFDTKFNSWNVESCELCCVKLSKPSDLVKHLATNKKHQDMIFASGTVTIRDINEYLNRMKEAAVRPLSVISSGSEKTDSLPQKVSELLKIPTVFTPTVTTSTDTKTKVYFPFLTGFNRTECTDIMPLDDVEKALSFWLKRVPDLMTTLTKLLRSTEIANLDLNCYYCDKRFNNPVACLQHSISSRHLNKAVNSGVVFSRSKDYVAVLQILENARRQKQEKNETVDDIGASGAEIAKKTSNETAKCALRGGATGLDKPVIKPQEEKKPVKPVVEVVPQCSVNPVQQGKSQPIAATPQSSHTIITPQADFSPSKPTVTSLPTWDVTFTKSNVSSSRVAPTPTVTASVGHATNRVQPEPAKKQPEVRRVTPLPTSSRSESEHTLLENKAIGSPFPLLGFPTQSASNGESSLTPNGIFFLWSRLVRTSFSGACRNLTHPLGKEFVKYCPAFCGLCSVRVDCVCKMFDHFLSDTHRDWLIKTGISIKRGDVLRWTQTMDACLESSGRTRMYARILNDVLTLPEAYDILSVQTKPAKESSCTIS